MFCALEGAVRLACPSLHHGYGGGDSDQSARSSGGHWGLVVNVWICWSKRRDSGGGSKKKVRITSRPRSDDLLPRSRKWKTGTCGDAQAAWRLAMATLTER